MLDVMSGSNSGVLGAIARSSDIEWLKKCSEHNTKLGNLEIVEAAKQRIRDVDLAQALKVVQGANTLEGRIMESLRVYREVLKHKHGRNQAAGYTERDIRNLGPRCALIKTIRTGKKTDGLKNLREWGRLDCSYEQIAIDFADELPKDVVDQARKTLAALDEA
ncbi:MAG TPA: hypothetical protein VKI44_17340 [Acetobacteraceae bacterium]|nr:hypothetical protein [Acetobacteraceae bacterium]